MASCVHLHDIELCLQTVFPSVFHIKSHFLEKYKVVNQKIPHICNKNLIGMYIFGGCSMYSEGEEQLLFCWEVVSVFETCLPSDNSGPKRVLSLIQPSTQTWENGWVGIRWFSWNSQNGLGFAIYVSGSVSIEFLCWEVSFSVRLIFFFCIPWVNKLLVTCEKQIPPTKNARRECYWNRRVSNKSLPKYRFWNQGRVLDQLHW